jgi:hypothetical protein
MEYGVVISIGNKYYGLMNGIMEIMNMLKYHGHGQMVTLKNLHGMIN